MRTFVIGDLHGALNALIQVLDKINYTVKDRLIFLGDYIDGWSDSARLIEYIVSLKEHNPNIITVAGNHDEWCGLWLNRGDSNMIWEHNGGSNTKMCYINSPFLTKQSHKDFFNNLLPYYIDENNNLFIHAGFELEKGLENTDPELFNKTRRFWQMLMYSEENLLIKQQLENVHTYNKIFIGHTPTINYYDEQNCPITKPIKIENVWNVDTGAGWEGGCLTILNVDTEEYEQSELVNKLYPNETGR